MTLIDTNVVSELMRRAPEPAVVRWMNQQPSSLLHVAAVSIAEIRYGIRVLPLNHSAVEHPSLRATHEQ